MTKIVGILILLLWISWSFLKGITHFSFTQPEYAENFRKIWILLVPLAICLLWYKHWRENKKAPTISIVLIICSMLVVLFFNFFHSVCIESFSDPIYSDKEGKKTIRILDFDCGATDSSPSNSLVIVSEFGGYLFRYEEIDTTSLDLEKWVKN